MRYRQPQIFLMRTSMIFKSSRTVPFWRPVLAAFNGVTQFMLARYSPFGTVDTRYGHAGYSLTPLKNRSIAHALALLDNDQPIAAGFEESGAITGFAAAWYTDNGTLDTTFNATGIVMRSIGAGAVCYGVAVDGNSKYVLGGLSIIDNAPIITLARYNSNGTVDTTFGNNGVALKRIFGNAGAYDIGLQSSGKIVAAGFAITASGQREFGLARFNVDGSVDTAFASNGTVVTEIGADASAYALAMQSNDYIIAAGVSDNKFALVRYNANGSLDRGFGSRGIVTTAIGASAQINDVVLQSDGKIIAVGFADNQVALARYTKNGSLDSSFGMSGTVTTAIGTTAIAHAVVVQPDGKIVVCGDCDTGAIVARYNADGSLDTAFGAEGITNFPNSYNAPDIFGITDDNISNDAAIAYGKLNLTNSIINSDMSASAPLDDSKLQTIKTPGKILNQATSASSLNVPNTIIARDTLGNFQANMIFSDLTGTVTGDASDNVLKAGDTMSGPLVLSAGSVAQPALQFSGSEQTGFSAQANTISMSTNNAERIAIDNNGTVTINEPLSGLALDVKGGGIHVIGDIVDSGNVIFNDASTALNAVGSTLGAFVKVFAGVGNTGLSDSVTVHYDNAGFVNSPVICANVINGVNAQITINYVTKTSAVISSNVINVPFNYIAVGI